MLSKYSSEHLYTDVLVLWKLLFDKHLILDVKQHSGYKKFIAKLLDIKSEGYRRYLVSEDQKSMFLVVTWLDVQFGFEHPLFREQCLERNLFTPDMSVSIIQMRKDDAFGRPQN